MTRLSGSNLKMNLKSVAVILCCDLQMSVLDSVLHVLLRKVQYEGVCWYDYNIRERSYLRTFREFPPRINYNGLPYSVLKFRVALIIMGKLLIKKALGINS